MKILAFILIGVIVGYVFKDVTTKESEVIYQIKKLRAKKGGEISVEGDVVVSKPKKITRRQRRKNG